MRTRVDATMQAAEHVKKGAKEMDQCDGANINIKHPQRCLPEIWDRQARRTLRSPQFEAAPELRARAVIQRSPVG